MKNKTCCFTGHRDISGYEYIRVKKLLKKKIEGLILDGVIYFGSGGAIGFDTLAARTVLKLKKKYPQIKLIMVYPCKHQTKFWDEKDREEYNFIKKHSDKYVYVSQEYSPSCYNKRNRHLVDNSNHCICYLNKSHSGTAYTVNYAKKKGLNIINLAKE